MRSPFAVVIAMLIVAASGAVSALPLHARGPAGGVSNTERIGAPPPVYGKGGKSTKSSPVQPAASCHAQHYKTTGSCCARDRNSSGFRAIHLYATRPSACLPLSLANTPEYAKSQVNCFVKPGLEPLNPCKSPVPERMEPGRGEPQPTPPERPESPPGTPPTPAPPPRPETADLPVGAMLPGAAAPNRKPPPTTDPRPPTPEDPRSPRPRPSRLIRG